MVANRSAWIAATARDVPAFDVSTFRLLTFLG